MNISDDLKMYLQERRRALLIEIDGIESLIGINENRQRRAERRKTMQGDLSTDVGFTLAADGELMRRG